MSQQTNDRFNDLLLKFSQEPDKDDRDALEKEIWDSFGVTGSPLVVDMSGFTRLANSFGIVHYLSMVRRMQLTSKPIIESYGGTLVKFEADNAFAIFKTPGDAIRASIALHLAMDSANLLTPDELDIHLSCGIDHGECILPHSSDYFGAPVNRASKLGGVLAEPGQILVTPEAMKMVSEELGFQSDTIELSVGGEMVPVQSIRFRRNGES